ncbi:MAG: putative sugar nucleotidyl transferase [Candidatus Kapaibacteriales bacterium]
MNPDYIILFENEYVNSLYPFSVLHLQWEVRVGALRLFEKITKQFPKSKVLFYTRRKKYLELFLTKHKLNNKIVEKGNILVLNSGILPNEEFWSDLSSSYSKISIPSVVFLANEIPVAFFLSKDDIINPSEFDIEFFPILIQKYSDKLPKVSISVPKVINFLWDAIEFNPYSIADDFRFFENQIDFDSLRKSNVKLIHEKNIKIGDETKISPFVVIDASKGPVIIGNNVSILSFAVIQGPVYIGDYTLIKPYSYIYGGTSIGHLCKVGGEVENTIIHSFSNKQHEGFIGHSYIGEWVNLGAGTITSDLKNTYGSISVRIWNETFDTGRSFLGLICGDHTKTAIGTTFNTGTIAGVCCNIYHSGLLPKFIASFTWGGERTNSQIGSFEKAIETAKKMMLRRNQELLTEEIELLRLEYESTKEKRFLYDVKKY